MMKEKCKGTWPGVGLIGAGIIVLLAGLTIGLFKEFNLPRHWIPAVVGAVLLLTGGIVRSLKTVYDHQVSQPKCE